MLVLDIDFDVTCLKKKKPLLSIKAYHNNSLIFLNEFEVYSIILNFNTVLQILVKHLTQN